MPNFLSKSEIKISKEFEKKGYVIRNISNKHIISIQNTIMKILKKELKIKKNYNRNYFLNNIHKFVEIKTLNSLRLKIINKINKSTEFKKNFYLLAKPYLNDLVGNELAMQNSINLSLQLPNDDSSLLPVHSDVWSGDSPFEIVVWLPLVNCYKTKSMFLLPPKHYNNFEKNFKKLFSKDTETIYRSIKNKLEWINIKSGQILLFNQSLPHGNRVNIEKDTRWSLNCRFKSIFSPYGDKKIGEFFQPITLKKITDIGTKYKLPNSK
tara:strand:+ start:1293 stop:2090 length:798 start_codon:yes stop_codon:yes gene_type:complete